MLNQLLKGTSYSIMLTAYTVVGPGPFSTDQCTTYTLEDGEWVMSAFCVYNNALLSLQFLMDRLSLLRLLLQLSPPSLSHGARLILHYRMVESSATSYCTPQTPHRTMTRASLSPLMLLALSPIS